MTQRITENFPVQNITHFKQKMLHWITRYNIFCLLDNHQYPTNQPSVEWIAGAGARNVFRGSDNCLQELDKFLAPNNDWLFGHLGYDLKNQIEPLQSQHPDNIGFPDIFFFQPEIVVQLKNDQCSIASFSQKPSSIFHEILASDPPVKNNQEAISIQPRINREEYLAIIRHLLAHIGRGDCYEINFCQEFFAENAMIHPAAIYEKLTQISPNPFSCFYAVDNHYLMCASPERWLQKKGRKLISQPIKGTIERNRENSELDNELKIKLQQSEKDRSENVMIVDLVRNDLSKICREGSVRVEELFGIYSFPQVHQMISTISGELREDMVMSDILKASFPMGSMTGAPKRKVMELIEKYEITKRGIYSGAVGYFSPENDFDFNVVIRSILYNANNKYLSYQVGGGITANSIPEKEYEECLLKASAIRMVLSEI